MTERAICRYEGCKNLVDLPHPYCRTHRDIVALEKLGISPSDVPAAKCQYPGCCNNAVKRSPGRYKKYCSQHLKHKEPCWICGWAEASCDSHRVWPGKYGGLYEVNNVTNLCPNHHRLCHHDFGKFCREIARRFKDNTLFDRRLIELMRSSRINFEIKYPGVSYFEEMKKSGHAKVKSRH
jgi:hypothetical protein